MRKIAFFTLIFLVLFTVSCEDSDSVSSTDSQSYSITITGLPGELTAPLGTERTVNFTVAVHSYDGIAKSGVEVSLSVVGSIGSVSPVIAITDENGLLTAVHTVTITAERQTVRILATANNQTASATYILRGVNPPSTLTLIPETNEIVVPAGSSGRIELDAVVIDESGVSVPGVKVRFQLAQYNQETPIFGSIFGNNFTDIAGRASATFRTDQGSGTVYAQVLIDDIGFENMSAQIPLTVRILEELPQIFTVDAIPDRYTNVNPDSLLTTSVTVTVKDTRNNGIPNLRVRMTTNRGALSYSEFTDNQGMIRVLHMLRPSADAAEIEGDFTATITAELTNLIWTRTATIFYSPKSTEPGNLTLITDRRYIWGDGPGLSYANIIAVLKDADGGSLANALVTFTTSFPYSVVQSPIMTDSLGRARTVFDDIGGYPIVENPDSVVVTAKYPPMGLEATVRIMIRERNPVTRIDLNANARQLTANSGDSTRVRATCYLSNGSPAPAGTQVFFDAVYGQYTTSVVPVSGSAGAATTFYIAGTSVATDTLIAYVQTPLDTAYSNQQIIELVSGLPSQLVIRANPREISVGSEESVTITATVMDENGNPVRPGTFITFTSSLGSIEHSAVTDIQGNAAVLLHPGEIAGLAVVEATVYSPNGPVTAETTVEFLNSTPATLNLSARPDKLQPQGTGGQVTSSLSISARDLYGNLVSGDFPVVVEILDCPAPPEGPSIGVNLQRIELLARNGVANTVLNSGTASLSALVSAYTFSDEERQDTIRAHTTIQISGGAPFGMNINVDENGYDAGGGAWEVEVAVNVWDESFAPVADGVIVNFELEPNIGIIFPARTGNANRRGVSEPGMAHSRFIYQSQQTFNVTTITAIIQTPVGNVIEDFEFVLPLQQGELMLNVDPANWMFDPDNEQADIRTWAILRDGHGVLINNAPILFTSNRARFWWKDFSNDRFNMFFPEPSRKLTGLDDRQNNDDPGVATVYLRAQEGDIFLDPFTLESQVRIDAVVEGYEDVVAQPRFVLFTRH